MPLNYSATARNLIIQQVVDIHIGIEDIKDHGVVNIKHPDQGVVMDIKNINLGIKDIKDHGVVMDIKNIDLGIEDIKHHGVVMDIKNIDLGIFQVKLSHYAGMLCHLLLIKHVFHKDH